MGLILIDNATVVLPDRVCPATHLWISDQRISACTEHRSDGLGQPDRVLQFAGDIVIPGLIDTHVHGAGGYDLMDGRPESLEGMGKTLLEQGTTAFLPTTMSAPLSELRKVFHGVFSCGVSNSPDRQRDGAEFLGVHLEGPFLSPLYAGAQTKASLASLDEDLGGWEAFFQDWPSLIKIMTLAPELPLARELVALCQAHGIIPSAGHSAADLDNMTLAIKWGIKHLTHAYNAMAGIQHRSPGMLVKALLEDAVVLELIADGVHIHPRVLELTLRLKGKNKVCLISDGIRAMGLPDGQYELGGQTVFLNAGVCRLANGTLAGSASPLLQGIRTLVKDLGLPLQQAVNYASLNPAHLLGVAGRLGSLEAGKEATFLRLSPELDLKQVWQRGELIYS